MDEIKVFELSFQILMSFIVLCWSLPRSLKTVPNLQNSINFIENIKSLFSQKSYLILWFSFHLCKEDIFKPLISCVGYTLVSQPYKIIAFFSQTIDTKNIKKFIHLYFIRFKKFYKQEILLFYDILNLVGKENWKIQFFEKNFSYPQKWFGPHKKQFSLQKCKLKKKIAKNKKVNFVWKLKHSITHNYAEKLFSWNRKHIRVPIITSKKQYISSSTTWIVRPQWAHGIRNVYVTLYNRSRNIPMSNVQKTFQKRSKNVFRTLDIGMFLERL